MSCSVYLGEECCLNGTSVGEGVKQDSRFLIVILRFVSLYDF
jgi:hypothetical protein